MLIYLSHEAKEKEWFSPTSPMMPIYLNHEAKVKSPTSPMIKITKHHDANFLIHEDKLKEWLSQFSKKSGYHFVGINMSKNGQDINLSVINLSVINL